MIPGGWLQLWEAGHAASSLPWWASIPLTTLAVRTALLPLTVKAKASSINVLLLHSAITQARRIAEALPQGADRALGRGPLVRRIMAHLRRKYNVPGFGWYMTNVAVQVGEVVGCAGMLVAVSVWSHPCTNTTC